MRITAGLRVCKDNIMYVQARGRSGWTFLGWAVAAAGLVEFRGEARREGKPIRNEEDFHRRQLCVAQRLAGVSESSRRGAGMQTVGLPPLAAGQSPTRSPIRARQNPPPSLACCSSVALFQGSNLHFVIIDFFALEFAGIALRHCFVDLVNGMWWKWSGKAQMQVCIVIETV